MEPFRRCAAVLPQRLAAIAHAARIVDHIIQGQLAEFDVISSRVQRSAATGAAAVHGQSLVGGRDLRTGCDVVPFDVLREGADGARGQRLEVRRERACDFLAVGIGGVGVDALKEGADGVETVLALLSAMGIHAEPTAPTIDA